MPTEPITRLRFRSAITLVVLYAVCAVLPSAVWAFPHGGTSSHCLTGDRHAVSDVRHGIHTPGDGAMDKRADNSMKRGDGKLNCHAGACCGVFCCAAITGDSGGTPVQPVHASLLFGALDERLDGREPKRIGRPPKPFLSL